MEVSVAFQQMAILFFGIILGYIAVKARVIAEAGSKAITNLVVNVILPFFIIGSGASSSRAIGGIEMLAFFLLSPLCYAVAYLILSFANLNIELVRVGTLLMAMPVATNATLLCIQYGGPDRTASRDVFLSTSLSMITIPLIVRVIG